MSRAGLAENPRALRIISSAETETGTEKVTDDLASH